MKTPSADKVIVIGPTDTWEARTVLHAVELTGFKLRICPTIYPVAAELGRRSVLLVVGTARALARENASLIELAEEMGVTCCCLLDASASLPSALIERMALDNLVLCHRRSLRAWLQQYLMQAGRRPRPGWQDEGGTSEPLVSTAEQAALLRGYGDD